MSEQAEMSAAELRALVAEVYGPRRQRQMAAEIDRSEVTVCRWMTGVMPVGGIEATLLRLILVLHRKGLPWRKWLNDYKNAAKPTLEDML